MNAALGSERKAIAAVVAAAYRPSFTEYLTLAVRRHDGKWIATEVECEVFYDFTPAEGDGFHAERIEARASIYRVMHGAVDLLPMLSVDQVANMKHTAMELAA